MVSDPCERKAAKTLERANAAKVLRHFARLAAKMGFNRRSTFFFRESAEVIQFLYLHKYTFGPYFEMRICDRVLNDSSASCTLAGAAHGELAPAIDFRYRADVESVHECADMMGRFVADYAEPWFSAWSNDALLSDTSFLRPAARAALAAHIAGRPDENNIQISRAHFYK